MAYHKSENLIRCPFFQEEKRDLLICEGCIRSTCMTTRFADEDAKNRHIRANCMQVDGGVCPLAQSVYALYEDEG